MDSELEIKIAEREQEKKDAFHVREQVFMIEQGMSKEVEFDEYDEDAYHVVVYLKSNPIGCARMRKVDSKIKIERIALLKDYRGRGWGNDIVEFMIDFGKKQHPSELFMSAQHYLQKFYEGFGFVRRGDIFKEGGIDHVEMYMKP